MLRMNFLNWFQSSWNWLSNLISFKDANGSVSSSQESTDSPWRDLAMEIHKVSSLFTLNQPLIRIKKPSNSA